jgi:Tol biopolymer transport system component
MLTGKMVFASGRYGDYDIFLLDLNQQTLTQLTSGNYWNDYPRLSPDCQHVLFTSNRNDKQEVWLMNIDGSDARSLTADLKGAEFPCWSPDGKKIAFVSNHYFQADIFTQDLETGGRERLTTHEGFDGYPDWSPDGRSIAYVSQRNLNQDIYLLDLETRQEKRITTHPAPDMAPAFSPDGQKLAFVSSRPDAKGKGGLLKSLWDYFHGDDDQDIWVISLRSGELKQITNHKGTDRHVRWSPDGRYLVFTNSAEAEVETRLMVYEYQTGKISPLGIDRTKLNSELQQGINIPVLTKSHPLLDKVTPEVIDQLYAKVGQKTLDRTYYATERYIDWR